MDRRTLRQKLEEMARRGTEHEQTIAREKLAKLTARAPDPALDPIHPGLDLNRAYTGEEITITGRNGETVTIRGVKVTVRTNLRGYWKT